MAQDVDRLLEDLAGDELCVFGVEIRDVFELFNRGDDRPGRVHHVLNRGERLGGLLEVELELFFAVFVRPVLVFLVLRLLLDELVEQVVLKELRVVALAALLAVLTIEIAVLYPLQ